MRSDAWAAMPASASSCWTSSPVGALTPASAANCAIHSGPSKASELSGAIGAPRAAQGDARPASSQPIQTCSIPASWKGSDSTAKPAPS